jgi:hypothetical protein
MATEYYLARARFLLRGGDPAGLPGAGAEQVRRDFAHVIEMNPNDANLRVEYADALVKLGTPDDRAEAARQYEEALRYDALLRRVEPKRWGAEKVAEIRQKIQGLKAGTK